ncbi:hypothetical protein QTP88_020142 [Uroleucon formosanum]
MSTKTVPFKMAACKCKYNCCRFTKVEVRTLHSEFWKQTPDNQGNFLYGLINITAVKQRRQRKENVVSRKRQVSVTYCLPKSNEGHVQKLHNIFKKRHSFKSVEKIQALSASKKETAINEPKKKGLLAMLDFLDEKYHAFYRDKKVFNVCMKECRNMFSKLQHFGMRIK